MNGLRFEAVAPPARSATNRVDVACFVGVVARRAGVDVPPSIATWLRREGWVDTPDANPDANLDSLLDVPVPIDTWDAFDALFEWEQRPLWGRGHAQGVAQLDGQADHAGIRVAASGTPFATITDSDGRFRLELDSGAHTLILTHASVGQGTVVGVPVDPQGTTTLPDTITLGAAPVNIALPPDLADKLPKPATFQRVHTYLGAAVRAFFGQGGRRCYVVRVGDPWALDAPRIGRIRAIDRLIPGHYQVGSSPNVRGTWRGMTVLHGLPDVSFLCLPDLPEAVSQEPTALDPAVSVVPIPEQFVECAGPTGPDPANSAKVRFQAPRCRDAVGWRDWRNAVQLAGQFLSQYRRDVQLIASIPLPEEGTRTDRDPMEGLLVDQVMRPLGQGGVSSRFVQLAWPWVAWDGSVGLPEGLSTPDGLLAGIIARSTLSRGTYHSAAGSTVLRAQSFYPDLSMAQRLRDRPRYDLASEDAYALQERVSLFGYSPRGPELLSDVSSSGEEQWRPANIVRVFSVVLRAAQRIGEETVFEASNEQIWARLKRQIEAVLHRLWELGGLRGQSPNRAYRVTCDRSTMSQNDIDNGRLIAHITVQPTAPIEQITVLLALDEGAQTAQIVDLRGTSEEAA